MKKRQTSVGLMRVVAMLMGRTLHVNFLAIGAPTSETIMSVDGLFRTVVQMMCICAVNAFVMISEWFGIRPTIKGFMNFTWLYKLAWGFMLRCIFMTYKYAPIWSYNTKNY